MNKKIHLPNSKIFSDIITDYRKWQEDNKELLIEAEKALARLKERENESVEEWAERLAESLVIEDLKDLQNARRTIKKDNGI